MSEKQWDQFFALLDAVVTNEEGCATERAIALRDKANARNMLDELDEFLHWFEGDVWAESLGPCEED